MIEEGILKIGFDPDNPVTGDAIVRDAQKRLKELIDSEVLTGGTLLKINGPMSIPVSYTIAHLLGHLYSAIAVFDPRLKSYIVAISTNPEYKLGDRIGNNGKILDSDENSEYSFLIRLAGNDTLKVGFNSKIVANNDRIVKDTAAQLDILIESGQLKGKLLKISGRASILASFVIASKLAHVYGAIAVFEPKEGEQAKDRYILTISHSPDYQVGQTLDLDSDFEDNSAKVVLCGPPGVGKTVLRDGLQTAIRRVLLDRTDDFCYVVSGHPDGDNPAWYTATAKQDAKLAYNLRKAIQARNFTPEYARAIKNRIEAIKNPLLLFDVGGKITRENEIIMSGATHAVILASSEDKVMQWQEFCEKLKLPVIAIIESDYDAKEDRINETAPVLKASVHFLERGEDASSRPTIQALAKLIISLVRKKTNKL